MVLSNGKAGLSDLPGPGKRVLFLPFISIARRGKNHEGKSFGR